MREGDVIRATILADGKWFRVASTVDGPLKRPAFAARVDEHERRPRILALGKPQRLRLRGQDDDAPPAPAPAPAAPDDAPDEDGAFVVSLLDARCKTLDATTLGSADYVRAAWRLEATRAQLSGVAGFGEAQLDGATAERGGETPGRPRGDAAPRKRRGFANARARTCWLSALAQALWHGEVFREAFDAARAPGGRHASRGAFNMRAGRSRRGAFETHVLWAPRGACSSERPVKKNCGRGRGVAATRLHAIPTSRPRRRRDPSAEDPPRDAFLNITSRHSSPFSARRRSRRAVRGCDGSRRRRGPPPQSSRRSRGPGAISAALLRARCPRRRWRRRSATSRTRRRATATRPKPIALYKMRWTPATARCGRSRSWAGS